MTPGLISALRFAAEKHRHHRRKDRHLSPYINHLIDVLHLLWYKGEVRDPEVLIAGLLHDTIEDTQTKPHELEKSFGSQVRKLVEAVTDDKSLPKAERKRLQVEHAPQLDPNAKLIKLADKCANLSDLTYHPPADWSETRRQEYLEWAIQVIAGIRGTNPGLEAHFDSLVANMKRRMYPDLEELSVD
ncbi:MAG: HD domain-containing protein [Bacteroidota bacterium]